MFLEAWRHRLRLEPPATSNNKSMENTSSVHYARDRSRKMTNGKGHPGYETNLRCVFSYKSLDSRDHRDITPSMWIIISVFPANRFRLNKNCPPFTNPASTSVVKSVANRPDSEQCCCSQSETMSGNSRNWKKSAVKT